MIRGLDSAQPPTPAQVAQAKQAGYQAWLGYIGKAGDNLLHPWTQADFQVITAGGLLTGAYCSGQDDPAWVRSTAAAWGLHVVILDDEAGIRADGSWVPGWLTTAGAGLYGGGATMREWANNPAVPFCVLAAYPNSGTQTATWSQAEAGVAAPNKPHGWQWAGTVPMFGTTVDLANYDPAIFATAPPDPQQEDSMFGYIADSAGTCIQVPGPNGQAWYTLTAAQWSKAQAAGAKAIVDDDMFKAYTTPAQASPPASGTVPSGTVQVTGGSLTLG